MDDLAVIAGVFGYHPAMDDWDLFEFNFWFKRAKSWIDANNKTG